MFWTVSQVVGALLLIHVGCRIVAFIHLYFLRSSSINRYLRSDNKAYALVTGATDGIGLALTKALLSRGFNAILHSRSEEKLQRISEQLRSEFPKRDVLYVAADASDPKTALPKVAAAVGRLEGRGGKLTVLVNNLGGQALFGGRTFNYFKDIPFEQVEASMNLNAIFPVLLTRLLLPSLLPTGHDGTTDQNEKALIINLGSYAGHYTIPLGAPYGISKALLHHFTRVLHLEASMTQPNLEVLGIMLAQVQTTGQGGDHTSFTVLRPDEMARDVVNRVGCGYDIVVGSWRHCVSAEGVKWMPGWVASKLGSMQVEEMARLELAKLEKKEKVR